MKQNYFLLLGLSVIANDSVVGDRSGINNLTKADSMSDACLSYFLCERFSAAGFLQIHNCLPWQLRSASKALLFLVVWHQWSSHHQ